MGRRVTRPVALDLFCKAGGAARGLYAAGFSVIGVDIVRQPRYPYRFLQADALYTLRCLMGLERPPELSATGQPVTLYGHTLKNFSFIWASPPCQKFTSLRHAKGAKGDAHPDLISPLRPLLESTGLPWAMENVEGAGFAMRSPTMLCGSQFKLGVTFRETPLDDDCGERWELRRHRLIETNFPLPTMPCTHSGHVIGVYGGHVRCRAAAHGGRKTKDFDGLDKGALAAIALGLPEGSMTMDEYSNAVPPAYARHVAEHALAHIKSTSR